MPGRTPLTAVGDMAEALQLQGRLGPVFTGVVTDAGPKGRTVQLTDPAVRAKVEGVDLPLGGPVDVVPLEADPLLRRVRFRRP